MKNMAQCRSCQAEVRWVKQKSGKMMPINPGTVYVGEKVYEPGTSHFATCPNAADHRQDNRRRLKEGMEDRRA